MPDELLSWELAGHNPTTWLLQVYHKLQLTEYAAKTFRKQDGAWHWSLFADRGRHWPTQGVEPSRLLAQEAATVNYTLYNNKILADATDSADNQKLQGRR